MKTDKDIAFCRLRAAEIAELLEHVERSKSHYEREMDGAKVQEIFELRKAAAENLQKSFEACDAGDSRFAFIWLCTAYAVQTILLKQLLSQIYSLGAETLEEMSEMPSKSARKAAIAKHKRNHDAKNIVKNYYLDNRGKHRSMDAASEYIAGRVVHYSFRTVRKWITEIEKELRAAGKG